MTNVFTFGLTFPKYGFGESAMNGLMMFEYSGLDESKPNIIMVPCECPIYEMVSNTKIII